MSDSTNALILAALDGLKAGQAKLEIGQANLRVEAMGRMDRLPLGDIVSAMRGQIQRLQTDVRHLKGEP